MTRNSFQAWADWYGRAHGFIVTPYANWVMMERDNFEAQQVFTVQGVQSVCELCGG